MAIPKNIIHITENDINNGVKYHCKSDTVSKAESAYSIVQSNSGGWGDLSNLNSVYTTVSANSGTWGVDLPISGYGLPLVVSNSTTGEISYTQLLMNFDGNIVDSSLNNHSFINSGAIVSTSQIKFGTGSLYVNGNTKYLKMIDYLPVIESGQDVTISFWLYTTGSQDMSYIAPILCNLRDDEGRIGWQIGITDSNRIHFHFQGQYTDTSNTFNYNTWNHIAIIRTNGTVKCAINGVFDSQTVYNNGQIDNPSAHSLVIGGEPEYNGSRYLVGAYIDNVIINYGIALWITNFTVPSEPLYISVNETSNITYNTPVNIKNNLNSNDRLVITDNSSNPYITTIGNINNFVIGGISGNLNNVDSVYSNVSANSANWSEGTTGCFVPDPANVALSDYGLSPSIITSNQHTINNCKMLFHFDGNLTNFGNTSAVITLQQLSSLNTGGKFGSGNLGCSLYEEGVAGCIITPNILSDLLLSNKNFTIDYWQYIANSSAFDVLSIPNYGIYIVMNWTQLRIYIGNGTQWIRGDNWSTDYYAIDGTNWYTGANWYHFAIIRSGLNIYIAINGVLYNIFDNFNYNINNTGQIMIQPNGGASTYDEFRVLIGEAAWTSNFTPPTAAYSNDITTITPYYGFPYVSTDEISGTEKITLTDISGNAFIKTVDEIGDYFNIGGSVTGDYLSNSDFQTYSGSITGTLNDVDSIYSTVSANSASWGVAGDSGINTTSWTIDDNGKLLAARVEGTSFGTSYIDDINSHLISCYKFSDNNFLVDSYGGYTLTNIGSVTQSISGKSGYCADFSGSNYFTMSWPSQTYPSFLVSVWFNLAGSDSYKLISLESADNNYVFQLSVNKTTGLIRAEINNTGGTFFYCDGNTSLSLSTWYNVSVYYDNTKAYMFLNGTLLATGDTFSGSYLTATKFAVGARAEDGNGKIVGQIDELYFWKKDTAIFSSDTDRDNCISALYNSGNGKFYGDGISKTVILDTGRIVINSPSGTTYQLQISDAGKLIGMDSVSANIVQIPLYSNVAFSSGTVISVSRDGTGITYIQALSGVTLNGVDSNIKEILEQYGQISLTNRNTDIWTIAGLCD